jgi:YggT family protein
MAGEQSFGHFIIWLLELLINGYVILIIIRALMSWFAPNPYNRFYLLLMQVTEPVLAPLRRIIPMSGIDFSPIIAILLINIVVKRILLGLLKSLFLY